MISLICRIYGTKNYKPNKNKLTDTKNKLVIAIREGGGGWRRVVSNQSKS